MPIYSNATQGALLALHTQSTCQRHCGGWAEFLRLLCAQRKLQEQAAHRLYIEAQLRQHQQQQQQYHQLMQQQQPRQRPAATAQIHSPQIHSPAQAGPQARYPVVRPQPLSPAQQAQRAQHAFSLASAPVSMHAAQQSLAQQPRSEPQQMFPHQQGHLTPPSLPTDAMRVAQPAQAQISEARQGVQLMPVAHPSAGLPGNQS